MNRNDIEEFDHVLSRIYRSFEKEYKLSILSVQPQGKLLSTLEGCNRNYSKEHSMRRCSIVINNSKHAPINTENLNQNQRLFLTKLSNLCTTYSHSNRVVLNKKNPNRNNDNTAEFLVDQFNDDNLLSYEDLCHTDFPWEQIKFKNYSKHHLKEYFNKLITDQECYDCLIKNNNKKCIRDETKKRVEIIQENGEKTVREVEEDTNLYCYCKQKYSPGDMMVCCEKGFGCIGSQEGWYHVQCIQETLYMSQEDINSYKFICNPCMKKEFYFK